ncbi:endonuclease/exonuclease/phosphatase family protein [Micromonospora sp. B11E3]|uniref:endonuclease/exonuclease/phosphatase family protein n=1 Tax=Micromonospora sp. B11E3 TaxID=3153562 RepID=UPI00325E606B
MTTLTDLPAVPGAVARPRRRPGRAVSRWSARAVVALAATWLAFVLAHLALTGRFWFWVLPDLVPPPVYALAPAALLLVAGLGALPPGRRRDRRWVQVTAGLSAVALLLGAGQSGLHPGALVAGRQPAVPPDAIRVFSWNTNYWDNTDDPDHFYRFLAARHADVYVLQEYMNWVGPQPLPIDDLARLRREFPDHYLAACNGLITISRFPVVAARTTDTAGEHEASWHRQFPGQPLTRRAFRVDLRVGERTVSVYNLHVPLQLGERKLLTANFYRDVRARVEHRADEFAALRRDLAANDNPLLVAGDFNTTAAMGDLRWLRGRLDDPATAGRFLYPATWPVSGPASAVHVPFDTPPLWRLDWAFTQRMRAYRYDLRDPERLSDHRGQEMVLAPTGGPTSAAPPVGPPGVVPVAGCAADQLAGYK